MYRSIWLCRTAGFPAAALCVLLLPCLALCQSAIDPPGRLIDIEGRKLHLNCRGSGLPTVIIDAGAGASSLGWLHIQERLMPFTRTCVYDRAGLGWSDFRPGPRTSEHAARELRALLNAAREQPPFALVGHSYGGYNVRVFTRLFAEDVAGLALIDSAHEDQWDRLPSIVKQLLDSTVPTIRAKAYAARQGRLNQDSVPTHPFFSREPRLDRAYRAEMVDPDQHEAHLGELVAMDASIAQVRASPKLGALPMVVLSSAREFDPYKNTPIPIDEANRIWLELQTELATLSSNRVHIVSQTGPHTIHYAEPEVVAGAIRELVHRIRANSALER